MPKFVPRERKHKVRQRTIKQNNGVAAVDSHASEILPNSSVEKEQRRQILRDELKAQQPRISGKKQKRLDKYIVRISHTQ